MNPIDVNRKSMTSTLTARRPVAGMTLIILLIMGLAMQVHPLTPEPTWVPVIRQAAVKSGALPFEAKLAPGTFLVASRRLRDPNFAKTVIFLIAYDENGAQGFVINRPSPIRVSRAFPKLQKRKKPSPYIYLGGPVAQKQMRILVQTGEPSGDMQQVLDDVYLSGSPEVLKQLMTQTAPAPRFRTFAGYAGWAPGQLEREIERGGWHIFHAEVDAIFDADPDSVWPRLIRKRDLKWF